MRQLSRLFGPARYRFAALALLIVVSSVVMAQENSSRSQTNRDIRVEPGQKAGDLSCMNCSIYIRGDVAGDVFAVHGNVVIDVGAIGGAVRRQPQAVIGGDVASLEGKGWLLLLLLCPLVILGLMIALIVWLVHLY